MRAQRAGAVREGAAQREVHALARRPRRDQFASRSAITVMRAPMKRAVRIRRARPDVALVDMGVHVDEARQHDAAVEIEARQAVAAPAGGPMAAMRAVLDHDVAGREAVGVGRSCEASATRHTGTRALARR